jgi:hypothetical protein
MLIGPHEIYEPFNEEAIGRAVESADGIYALFTADKKLLFVKGSTKCRSELRELLDHGGPCPDKALAELFQWRSAHKSKMKEAEATIKAMWDYPPLCDT